MTSTPTQLLATLNERAQQLCDKVIQQAVPLDVGVSHHGNITLIDFGVNRLGTFEGGLLLSRICLADLANVSITAAGPQSHSLPQLQIVTDWPLEACIASQYAGWPFAHDHYYAMASGPGRLARGKEEILERYQLTADPDSIVLVLESDEIPGPHEFEQLTKEFGNTRRIYLCIASPNSLPGTLQVVARSVETAMHKLFELGFELSKVRRAIGIAPIPPIGETSFQSLGWTNDAILYGGRVDLWFDTTQDQLTSILDQLTSASSADFGQPFADIFEKYNRDFYQIDRLLFSPAEVCCYSLYDGKKKVTGQLRPDILDRSFGESRGTT